MYRPLPACLTIKNSEIEGLGLFAKEFIPSGTLFGMSHIKVHSDWIRTPLGGFYNYSTEPNCMNTENKNTFKEWLDLVTIKDIEESEELTADYIFYKVK